MSENVEFIKDLAAVVQKHYPDGKMKPDDIAVYFGMVMAGALASQPEPIRDRAARILAQMIRHPDQTTKGLGR